MLKKNLHQFGYVNSFDVWVPHKLSRKNILDHTSTCNSLLKCNENMMLFKASCDGQWKVHTVQWCGMEEIMRQVRTITNHTKGWSSNEGDAVYIMGLEGSPLIQGPSGKLSDWFQQVLLPIRPTESSTQWKGSRLSQKKIHNFPSR